MKELTITELRELPFCSRIKIVWHNSEYHDLNAEYIGVIFGDKIGYEDGLVDRVHVIAESMHDDRCMVYLM